MTAEPFPTYAAVVAALLSFAKARLEADATAAVRYLGRGLEGLEDDLRLAAHADAAGLLATLAVLACELQGIAGRADQRTAARAVVARVALLRRKLSESTTVGGEPAEQGGGT